MTHPIISAYVEASSFETYPTEPRDCLRLMDLDDIVADVMASSLIPDFWVGFYNGANNKTMFIWLWPLKSRFIAEVQYWVDNQRYEYDFCRANKAPQWTVSSTYQKLISEVTW